MPPAVEEVGKPIGGRIRAAERLAGEDERPQMFRILAVVTEHKALRGNFGCGRLLPERPGSVLPTRGRTPGKAQGDPSHRYA